ncbi:NADP-reducing hydrogenase subunit HndC [Oxobacter pfennigii]|uniref:NADP-reducing hydrogenase subunit HndC n=1 Tax=Oxobacter pfennigii TaxID=36849 RepID=A0A0P8YWI1_9CLOT|nr:2Fe-2S iron-sulfur cluster-binding protein [Oxobacter pfennigii]KPU44078.1 NADP-reducing hydrogenase subunit HndC [Oxobacter pfennigii]
MAVKLVIDGINVEVQDGTTILEAAKSVGINIPTFCYDPSMEIYGGCRICVVEVERARTLVASCTMPVSEGMVVYTESPRVVEARKSILTLMLANHPNDCLTCEKAGVCKLQEYAYRYEVRFGEITGDKHSYEIEDNNPYIERDMNKCILCGKCVRTCSQVEGRKVLGFINRGFNTKVSPAFDVTYAESNCVHCFRCVSVCPVGALKDKRAAGQGRKWELEKKEVDCTFCDYGCKFEVGSKKGKVVYVTPKNPGNGRPLCLKGKIGNELKHVDNPKAPYIKEGNEFVETTWPKALGLEELIEKIVNSQAR